MELMLAEKYNKALRYILSNPVRHNLWYGFDNTAKLFADGVVNVDAYRIYDVLRQFYEATGGRAHQEERISSPLYIDVDDLAAEIEKSLGLELVFPAPYAKMRGLANDRGLIRERALWGLYLAWRANQNGAKSILELGGGLDYGAFYSSLFGADTYAIVDLPLTLVASGHFLGLSLGENNINLYGEGKNSITPDIALLPPNAFPVD